MTTKMLRDIILCFLMALCGVGVVLATIFLATGQSPHPLEIVGATANVWGMLLIRKQNIFGWVTAIISTITIGLFSLHIGIYGQAFLQMGFFLPTALYALWVWKKKAALHQAPLWLTGRQRLITAICIATLFFVSYFLVQTNKNFIIHLADVLGLTFVMAGHFLMVLKKKDCWLVFIPGNSVIALLYYMTGGYMVAALNIFFLINGIRPCWNGLGMIGLRHQYVTKIAYKENPLSLWERDGERAATRRYSPNCTTLSLTLSQRERGLEWTVSDRKNEKIR